jgi:aminopeptidase N
MVNTNNSAKYLILVFQSNSMTARLVKLFILLTCFITWGNNSRAQLTEQQEKYTRADTLRGSLRPERECYDVEYYELNIKIDTATKSISGSNKIKFNVVKDFQTLQIDLFENMVIDKIISAGKELTYKREFNAVFVTMPFRMEEGMDGEMIVYYHGTPIIAKRAPWDGGFTWTKNKDGRLWMAVSCEGIGASLWWPTKEDLGDEPDSMRIICNVPSGLMCVSNGNLYGDERQVDGTTTYTWRVGYPINNYNVTLNVGDYVQLHDEYDAEDGEVLSLDYYVMTYNKTKARAHFAQVKPMMKCYEKYLGKYPFWKDGYALVETPYLGMEHQGAIAYGNRYLTGYAGSDYSRIGLDFDYIIIHETGHEWWGNSVTCKDIADMWIHEGFCTYTESIYVECLMGYDKAQQYINAKRSGVDNKAPMIGKYGVNEEGDGDMYSKGALLLNTLRTIVADDALWWATIKNMADTTFKMRNVSYNEVVNFFNDKTKKELTPVFEQYVKHADIPTFTYTLTKAKGNNYTLKYKWIADVKDFKMPVYISTAPGTVNPLGCSDQWQTTTIKLNKADDFKVMDTLEYINVKEARKAD